MTVDRIRLVVAQFEYGSGFWFLRLMFLAETLQVLHCELSDRLLLTCLSSAITVPYPSNPYLK
jgi:hypothetical protein